ncbi:peptidoglycan DD-metalloendopeptidase family protein [bacterium]|nr:peptidoglycan DD-metalloendopeptidase family protein [bacterium]
MIKTACSLIIVFFFATSAFGATRYEELQQKVTERGSQIEQLEKEIAGYKTELVKTAAETKTLGGAIRVIDLNRKKLGADISVTANRIESSEASIEQIGLAIDLTEKKIERSRTSIAGILRAMDDSGSRTFAEVLLLHNTMSEALLEIGDFQSIHSRIREEIENLKSANEKMTVQKAEQETEKKKLVSQKEVLADQKTILDSEKKEKDSLLSQTKNKESNYKKMLTDAEARKEAMEQELENFAAELKQEIDPGSLPLPGTKVFSPPLDVMRITQKFGRTVDSLRLYSSGTHNGIDFGASRGTKVYAMADGIVSAVGNTDEIAGCYSYGKWILIKHASGLSTMYAHLDLIKAAAGAEVKRGDIIGYSGKTGYATGPHLHLTVYASAAVKIMKYESSKFCKSATIPIAPTNAYLDPEVYM